MGIVREVVETGFGQGGWHEDCSLLSSRRWRSRRARRRDDSVALAFLGSAIAATRRRCRVMLVWRVVRDVLSDAVHVAAAGVWVGGLAFVDVSARESEAVDRWAVACGHRSRFSTLAAGLGDRTRREPAW